MRGLLTQINQRERADTPPVTPMNSSVAQPEQFAAGVGVIGRTDTGEPADDEHVSLGSLDSARQTGFAWIDAMWITALGLSLCGLTWKKWPHALIDFGRELYTPWRLSEGDVLYRDVEAIFGPLSQYVNATWFRVAGTSLTSLCILNLALLIGLALMMHAVFRRIAGRATANLTSACFLTVFAFAQYNLVGNNNFIAPYSHEATHGVILSVAMIYCLTRFTENPLRRWIALAGLCAGATLLTKPEIALAAVGTASAGLVALATTRHSHGMKLSRPIGLFAASATVPLVGFFAYFRQHTSSAEAFEWVGGAFRFLFTEGITSNSFYQSVTGLDRPWTNTANMVLVLFGSVAAIGSLIAVSRYVFVPRSENGNSHAKLVVAVVVFLLGLKFAPWFDLARPLPVSCAGVAAVAIFQVLGSRREWPAMHRDFPLLLWSCFATLMLIKVALRTTVAHYGFYLAMPATLLAIAALRSLIPRVLSGGREHGSGPIISPAITALTIAGILVLSGRSYSIYSIKTLTVGTGADKFTSFDADTELVGTGVADALRLIEAEVPDEATLVVLPEGIMLNYLSRRRSSIPYINFMPPELMAFGEGSIIAALKSSPPDYIVVAHKDATEYGVGDFGSDPCNGQELMGWVYRNYRPDHTVLNEPFTSGRFGMAILRREEGVARKTNRGSVGRRW